MNNKKNLKICHLTSAHKSNDTRIFYKECTSLANFGYDTFLVVQGKSRRENNVNVIGVGKSPKNRFKRMFVFSSKIYRKGLELDCDIYHLHDPELLLYVRRLKRRKKIVIFDSHEDTLNYIIQKTWIPKMFRKTIHNLYKKYANKIFRIADALITVTPHVYSDLLLINENTEMITNYPILEPFVNTYVTNKMILCFTGGISSLWNHEIIIESLNEFKEIEYNLCGKITNHYLEKLKKIEGWDKVNFFGLVNFQKSQQIQRESSIGLALVSPSMNSKGMQGTLGNTKIFEYMASGLPIIGTDFILWEEINNKYNCFKLINPQNKKDLVEAITYFQNNPKELINMGKNARKAVEEEYNWKTQELVLIKLYKDLSERIFR